MTYSNIKDTDSEESFHDRWADEIRLEKLNINEFFTACTAPENRFILECLGNISGKNILDLGCGAGEAAVFFAKHGGIVTASDLSSGMLRVAQKLALKNKVSIEAVKCDANLLHFPDETFDIVYAANVLHHSDINLTLSEISRVLKPGGVLASWDPLVHNPLINIYRKLATKVRTSDEQPLNINQLSEFKRFFCQVQWHTTWLLTLLVFVKFFLVDRIHPNKERYWKKIIYDHRELENFYNPLESLDRWLLERFPGLRKYCWNLIVIAKK